jgi:hypothetical protein
MKRNRNRTADGGKERGRRAAIAGGKKENDRNRFN